MQFALTCRDGTDPDALSRRLAVREAHIALGDEMKAKGKHLYGVALLDEEGVMRGSILIVDFESRDELDEWLTIEPYVTGNVWQSIEVEHCKVGPSFVAP